MSWNVESAVKDINLGSIFLNACQISGHSDGKYTAIELIELILHKFEEQKIANFF